MGSQRHTEVADPSFIYAEVTDICLDHTPTGTIDTRLEQQQDTRVYVDITVTPIVG